MLQGVEPSHNVPEIYVTKNDGAVVISGERGHNFETVDKGNASAAYTLIILNTGEVPLTNLGISLVGAHPEDFTVSGLTGSELAVDAITTLAVIFRPQSAGTRSAVLHITSNDADENPFVVNVTGTGQEPPAETQMHGSMTVAGVLNLVKIGGINTYYYDTVQTFKTLVRPATESVQLRPVVADADATVRVNGLEVASNTLSTPIALATGANHIPIRVSYPGKRNKLYTVIVTRQQALSLSPSEMTVSATQSMGNSFSVSSDGDCRFSSDQPWLQITPGSGTGNGICRFDVQENHGAAARVARITVTSSGQTKVFTLRQNAASAERLDSDGDGVMNMEDMFPSDASRYTTGWKIFAMAGKGMTQAYKAVPNSPLEILRDGWSVWTIATNNRLQATWWDGSWKNYVFTAADGAPVLNPEGGMATDTKWDIIWTVGANNHLQATWLAGNRWRHAPVGTGNYERIHLVDSHNHWVWARKNLGFQKQDVVVYLAGGRWNEAAVPMGGAVAFSAYENTQNLVIGWGANDGQIIRRYSDGKQWLAGLMGAALGTLPTGTEATMPWRQSYGYDRQWQLFWFGNSVGRLEWLSPRGATLTKGVMTPANVWPGSSTWVASGNHFVFCRDGIGAGDKVRVYYPAGAHWKNSVVGPYRNFQGDQAEATSAGRLYFVNPTDGSLNYLGY